MKIKTLSLIAAAFAVTLTATPFIAQAQDAPAPQQGKEYRRKGAWKKLGLTEEQKTKIMAIRRDTRDKMLNVLTPTQKEQLKAEMEQRRSQALQGEGRGRGKRKKHPFASLNLTDAQKNQMRAIKDSAKQQMKAILTPAQLEQIEQMRQNRRSRR
ncbi:MAG: P pilus assembly/Cpx signaling pathway, periplasmic inhibitor/zinc-resistance associated protein [Sphaerospermopsis sp. SIO1G2]|nr:P pilus assembly/Cpx signaling pathway, periplasmic inhibitor/zinc-resistance associated protein [Sphaerospermopsis sp. SIO1G1]NET71069.1 P pilus assembly/Cpx signaling pathway, periplasmic inhibitor/zinc-resistance associated protein [Sphaerospermopsis sp. SIO1G2]